jgi:hypothetical protein
MFAFPNATTVAGVFDEIGPRFLLIGAHSNRAAFVAQSDTESQRANRHFVCLPGVRPEGPNRVISLFGRESEFLERFRWILVNVASS